MLVHSCKRNVLKSHGSTVVKHEAESGAWLLEQNFHMVVQVELPGFRCSASAMPLVIDAMTETVIPDRGLESQI